ncbi:MAG: Rne/Rng family ribonuclease [Caulobacterales bacterium]|jgi:ribonuclease E
MAKKMLIDAAHPEETRVVVMDGFRVDDFDFEVQNRKQLRGNIYLAKVTRVEPSLQACFVEYGGNRHGFLAFPEIHPDYYQIPVDDREALKAEVAAAQAAQVESSDGEDGGGEEDDGDILDELRRRLITRRYKIQEVVRRRQVMLVQVVKEERGNKGAALTTYLSLAGRYCVLMPNTARGGGISRKITNSADRKRLKKIATDLELPNGMGLIIRTAGAKRTKTEIKRDYEYLIRQWETIRDMTMRSIAPALIYEESSLVKRAIRDLYDKDVDEVHVEGEAAYREAKDFVRMLMPSHAKRVHAWKGPGPILTQNGAERQLSSAFSPTVNLKSGGYIVINQTEALVAIDVNSGRATRERNIEQTALKTNLEAAEEAARQIRLRDLAGLVVIDFIDMEEAKNDRAVEKRMKDSLRFDRSRVQMGKISPFGLLELSRQRRRTGIVEGSSHVCHHCGGSGRVRSVESSALNLLRAIEESAAKAAGGVLEVRAATDVALYVLNDKRSFLEQLEQTRDIRVRVLAGGDMMGAEFDIGFGGPRHSEDLDHDEGAEPVERPQRAPREEPREAREPRGGRGGRGERAERYGRSDRATPGPADVDSSPDEAEDHEVEAVIEADGDASGRRRRRGRRGGRRGREGGEGVEARGEAAPESETPRPADARGPRTSDERGRRRRRRRGRGRSGMEFDGGEHFDFLATDPIAVLGADIDDGDAGDEDDEGTGSERPEAEVIAQAEPAAAAPARRQGRERGRGGGRAPAAEAEPASEAALPDSDPAPVALEVAAPSPVADAEPEPAAPALSPAQLSPETYQPDQERRDRFFSRLRPWGKKDI